MTLSCPPWHARSSPGQQPPSHLQPCVREQLLACTWACMCAAADVLLRARAWACVRAAAAALLQAPTHHLLKKVVLSYHSLMAAAVLVRQGCVHLAAQLLPCYLLQLVCSEGMQLVLCRDSGGSGRSGPRGGQCHSTSPCTCVEEAQQ